MENFEKGVTIFCCTNISFKTHLNLFLTWQPTTFMTAPTNATSLIVLDETQGLVFFRSLILNRIIEKESVEIRQDKQVLKISPYDA